MGTYRHTRTRGRVTSCCTWCGATSRSGTEAHVERWQRRHVCCPEKTRDQKPRSERRSDAGGLPVPEPTHESVSGQTRRES